MPQHASGMQLVLQFKQLLAAVEAKVAGYDELKALLENEQRSVRQLERALQLQQRHIDKFSAQDLLLAQLTQQMALQAQTFEQLQSKHIQQAQNLASAKTDADRLEQEVGNKRKRIESLEWHGSRQNRSIKKLEHQLQQYKRICSYVTHKSRVSRSQRHHLCLYPTRALGLFMRSALDELCAFSHHLLSTGCCISPRQHTHLSQYVKAGISAVSKPCSAGCHTSCGLPAHKFACMLFRAARVDSRCSCIDKCQ